MKDEADASPTCDKMPDVLGANIIPHKNSALLTADVPAIQAASIYEISDGELVGVIGIDVKRKTMESSQPDPETIFLDEIETTIAQVAELESAGVNKIVLLTHIGYDNDQNWIASIPGVDVVVGGDSHSLLGNNETAVISSTRGSYATVIERSDGKKVCVVQAWDYSKMIGNLDVDFDENGNVISCSGHPVFPLNPEKVTVRDASPRFDMSVEDAAIVMEALNEATKGQAKAYEEDASTANDLDVFSADVEVLTKAVVATSSETISLEAGGFESGACDLVAQGFLLNPLSSADVAIQNRGGCRASIEEVRKCYLKYIVRMKNKCRK